MQIYPINSQSNTRQTYFKADDLKLTKEFEQKYNYTINEFITKPYNFKKNIYGLGQFLKENFTTMNENIIDITLKMTDDIQNLKGMENIKYSVQNVINIIFSVIIKNIKPEDIISGRISPEYYMKLVNKSIELYKNNKIGDEIDYRHIIGRMLSHKNLYDKIVDLKPKNIQQFKIMKWELDNQLDLIGMLELIKNNFSRFEKSFITPEYKKSPKQHQFETLEETIENFNNNVLDLLKMIASRLIIVDPKEKEFIEDITDYANMYADRVNIDYKNIDNIYRLLNKINSRSLKLLGKK